MEETNQDYDYPQEQRTNSTLELPLATALADDTPVSNIFSQSGRNVMALTANVVQESQRFANKAAFVSIKIAKSSAFDPLLGLSLSSKESDDDDSDRRIITNIDPSGPLLAGSYYCPLKVGYQLVSINNKDLTGQSSEETLEILREVGDGYIHIVASCAVGKPQYVESMVEKLTPTSVVGLKFGGGGQRRVKITAVQGLFASSLLNVGDEILSINGGPPPQNSREVKRLIQQATTFVSVKTERVESTGAVLAAFSFIGTAPREEGTDTHSHLVCCVRCFLLVTVVLFATFMSM